MDIKTVIGKSISKASKIIQIPYRFIIAICWLFDINKRKNKNDIIIVLLKGVGDTLYGLSCLDSLKDKNINSKIIIIGNITYRDLILGYKSVNQVKCYDVKKGEYAQYECFIHSFIASLIGLRINIFNSNPYFAYKIKKSSTPSSAIELLKREVFKVDDKAGITYPQIKRVKQITSIPGFYNNTSRIVLINPYSNSMDSTLDIYKIIAKLLRQSGYIPYVNLLKGQEGIEQCEELYCSIEELYEIARHVAGVVSVRSGILDLLINTGTPVFTLYYNCTSKFRNIYNLNAWKSKTQVVEVLVTHNNEEKIINSFLVWMNTKLNI
ncbi:MAG: hypothetical protein HFH66_07495 [Lachnospiraceae bacterium]|nr:hypothetical protein [Lachnospiraceae bacterium]